MGRASFDDTIARREGSPRSHVQRAHADRNLRLQVAENRLENTHRHVDRQVKSMLKTRELDTITSEPIPQTLASYQIPLSSNHTRQSPK